MVKKKEILEKLKEVRDPEIAADVVELGFIRDVQINDDDVLIKMTLTNPMCPMHSYLTREVRNATKSIEGVERVKVKLVFDPPWSPEMMAEEARERLGVE